MKTTERRRLKENEVAYLIDYALEVLGTNRQRLLAVVVVLVVAAGGLGGYVFWRTRTAAQGASLLAEAMTIMDAPVTSPAPAGKPAEPGRYPTEQAKLEAALTKFLATAASYPKTEAGILARYQAASLLATLEKPAEAAKRFQEVMDLAGSNSIHYDLARLGKVNAQAQAAQFDEAITTFQNLASTKDGDIPPDAMLMQLGRIYLIAGKTTEARQTFRRLLDEYPESQFASDAKREFDLLSLIS